MKTDLALPGLRVLRVRDESVVLDSDLAALDGVETKAFNQAIKRNAHRFPSDFAFRLNGREWTALRSQVVTLNTTGRGRHRKYLPWVFTEHGAIMAATLLNSDQAVKMSTYVVRAFVRLRQWAGTQAAFAAKLDELDARVGQHDEQLAALIEALRQLAASPDPQHDRKIGFDPANR